MMSSTLFSDGGGVEMIFFGYTETRLIKRRGVMEAGRPEGTERMTDGKQANQKKRKGVSDKAGEAVSSGGSLNLAAASPTTTEDTQLRSDMELAQLLQAQEDELVVDRKTKEMVKGIKRRTRTEDLGAHQRAMNMVHAETHLSMETDRMAKVGSDESLLKAKQKGLFRPRTVDESTKDDSRDSPENPNLEQSQVERVLDALRDDDTSSDEDL